MNDYKFSVLICVYGGDNALHFDQAMNSVFKQTLLPDEVVLVVDGPVDTNIQKIIDKYKKNDYLKVVQLEKNMGLGIARNIGLKHCSNNLVAVTDADDLCMPDRFEKQIKMFKNNNDVSVVGGQISEFIEIPDNIVGIRVVPEQDYDIKEYMKKRCPMNHVTVMFKISDIDKVGGYLDWYYNEDYYLWIRMALQDLKFSNLPDILVNVRVSKEMYQRRGGVKYFKSEAKLQHYMLAKKLISPLRYLINVAERLIVQMLMPNRLRGWVFKKLARK